jgi:hypothetical protein
MAFSVKADSTLMQNRSTRAAWLSTSTLLTVLGLASILQYPLPPITASAASTPHSAQVLDPTLQALATQAALAATEAAGIPTPNPTQLTRAIDAAGAITLHGILTIDGAVQISGMYANQMLNVAGIRPDVVSCAAFAQGTRNTDGTGFSLPYPSFGTTVGGHSVLVPVSVSPYPGPGVYGRDQGVQLGPGVVIDDVNYLIADESHDYVVTVNPDGSGSFTFTNLRAGSLATGQATDATISGSDVWTCTPQP